MSSTQRLGANFARSLSPQPSKRTAEQAGLSDLHDATRQGRRRVLGGTGLRSHSPEQLSAFMPTPGLPPTDAPSSSPRAHASPRQLPPPLPAPQTSLPVAERELLRLGLTANSPAERLQSCIYKWSRQTNDRLNLQGLQNVLEHMAACDHLPADDTALVGALQLVADMRLAFGDNVEPRVRKAWFAAMDIVPREVPPVTPVMKKRRSEQAARLCTLRAMMTPTMRDQHTQRLLMTATGTCATLAFVEKFLRGHTAFEMSLDAFISITLGHRSDKWLAAADWDNLTTMAGHIALVATSSAQAQALIPALLTLGHKELRMFRNFMDHVCGAPNSPAQQALWLQMFVNIARHGYAAVTSCRRALIPGHTSSADKLRIAQALGALESPQAVNLASEVLRPGGGDPRKIGLERQDLIELLTRLPHDMPFQVDTVTTIMRQGMFVAWVRAMKDTPLRGEGVAEAIAAGVLMEGEIQGDDIVFSSSSSLSPTKQSWRTRRSNVPLLMEAAQAWGIFNDTRLTSPGYWMCQLAGEAIVATNGRIISWVRDNVPEPTLRAHFASAVSASPEALMAKHLRKAVELSLFMGLATTETAALIPTIMAVARDGSTSLARAFIEMMALIPQTAQLSHASVLQLTLDAKPQLEQYRVFNRGLAVPLPAHKLLLAIMPYYATFSNDLNLACALLQRTFEAAQPFARDMVTLERLIALPKAVLRVREALPIFLERAQARGVSGYEVLNLVALIAQLPSDGVSARITLAVFQTDNALTMLASPPAGLTSRDVFGQLVAQAAQRARDAENVHDALRMRSTDAAIGYLRGLGDGTPLDIDGHEQQLIALINTLAQEAPAHSAWHRRRALGSRTTIENARYVMMGTFAPGADFSRSVVQTPAYRELCALIWRAIAIYQHPSSDAQARAHEQKLMREDTVLALAECVKDENQGRVCSVGFKQRLISVLQGDDRYPEVLVDTLNAAQLLGALSETFDKALQGREPRHEELATFATEAVHQARRRFAENPAEAAKFEADLQAFLSVQYDYPSESGSQPA